MTDTTTEHAPEHGEDFDLTGFHASYIVEHFLPSTADHEKREREREIQTKLADLAARKYALGIEEKELVLERARVTLMRKEVKARIYSLGCTPRDFKNTRLNLTQQTN